MNTAKFFRTSCLVLLGLVFSTSLWAHGGAAGTDTDQCKFELEPSHWIHYTAYQPVAYSAEEFCGKLPALDTKTQLVFDYQDMRYRNMTIEFEVTKEPEGTSTWVFLRDLSIRDHFVTTRLYILVGRLRWVSLSPQDSYVWGLDSASMN